MKIIGIIVEYNPLHNGHVYHFNNIKKDKDDIVVAAMSSSLVNRGEISVFNKFDKTKLAIELGIDIILEIPSVYTIQSADVYAKRAVEILNYIGASEIFIGSEEDDIKLYETHYNYMNTPLYQENLKKYLKEGNSFKTSSQLAFNDGNIKSLMPNDILGLFYYKAIKDNNYNITLNTIKRTNDYSSTKLEDEISSATSIRLNQDKILKQTPTYVYNLFKEKGFLDTSEIYDYLKINIFNLNLSRIFLIEEGFQNSLKDVYKYKTYHDFITSLNTKRYNISKISRIMLNILFNIKKDDMDFINESKINYVRVLGYSLEGKEYLNNIKHDKTIYTNIKEGINMILDYEIKISKILDVIYNLNLLELEQKGPIRNKKIG